MHWDSIYDLATLGMWADPGSYAWYVGGPRYLSPRHARLEVAYAVT